MHGMPRQPILILIYRGVALTGTHYMKGVI